MVVRKRDDQGNMVAFEPPEPSIFDPYFKGDEFNMLYHNDKQAATAGKFGHFVL